MPEDEVDADIPLYRSEPGLTAVVVKCHLGHLAARETFEAVGGCPYCNHTPGERIAALRTKRLANRARPSKKTAKPDATFATVVEEGVEAVRRASVVKFTLGDIALDVAPLHEAHIQGIRPLVELAEALDIPSSTLTRYRRVAAAWPHEKRDSRASWSVHAILAGHPDRFHLIKQPPPGSKREWTCQEARNAMRQSGS
ncbi:DUF6192 family protein [Streptomyces sp. ISL-100]|uniref:DUF6192 family protein n=1 Tax=Streptomyces sp. ISL-100 TaxID=2819173 RepID=UPI001BE5214D|nr:DUF6192 family protein [Streptomyces sp. ISL-100]MBT2401124.1 hypothetical protein [Streptomyces sp. ISL-100]